jgi:hypothetical protein
MFKERVMRKGHNPAASDQGRRLIIEWTTSLCCRPSRTIHWQDSSPAGISTKAEPGRWDNPSTARPLSAGGSAAGRAFPRSQC